MRFHWLRLRATAHATEDPERVRQALQFLSGLDDEAFDEVTEATPVEAHHGGEVIFFETNMKRAQQVRSSLRSLLIDRAALLEEVEQRTDDDGVLYFRFDKQAAYAGKMVPTRGDDAVQVRVRPEVHPAKRENALVALRELLETGQV